jgi:hypothetical protein
MAEFAPGTTIETEEPTVTVDGTLGPGEYRFELVVEDERGQTSEPDVVVVVVKTPDR